MRENRTVRAGRSGVATMAPDGPIVRPLPADEFDVHERNAEMRWEIMRGKGYVVPNTNFFVRNHTATPLIDAETWSLSVFGTGLRGAVPAGTAVRFSYQDLLDLPAQTMAASIECAGNGRSFFASQQRQAVPGTPWRLGAIGVAAWRGVPLSVILDRSGITREAVDVMPYGLDPDFASGGVNYGPVRRPIPVAEALDDVILAYEMTARRCRLTTGTRSGSSCRTGSRWPASNGSARSRSRRVRSPTGTLGPTGFSARLTRPAER